MTDITLLLGPDLLVWPGNPPLRLRPVKRLRDGADADVAELSMSTQGGTHVDAPGHVVPGAPTIESAPLEALIGPCVVVDLTDVRDVIRAADLARATPEGTSRLLLRTRNSAHWAVAWASGEFPDRFVSLGPDAARWLVEHGVITVGIDFLGIEERSADGRPVHRTLIGGGVTIIEGLDLRDASPGRYLLVCLPLRLAGADGAPARAVLIEHAIDWA